MEKVTISQLKYMHETEDHVEFKKGEGGNVSYNGHGCDKPHDRRRCILGYVAALCNEGGGYLVIGMHDDYPHKVVGTTQCKGAIGKLESEIYRDLGIRPFIYELFDESGKRVLVIQVPKRPVGKVFKFEDVALMRVGEEIRPMDDKTFLSILQEQEPDFSEQICEKATFEDLDPIAIDILKKKYSIKQKNPSFFSISNEQALSDLKLVVDGKITNAAVLLVGKEDTLSKIFPQSKVMLEFRGTESQIHYDNRFTFSQPFFILIDKLWDTINVRNGSMPIRNGAYIFDIPFFNEDVIREIVNNAFAHRDYRKNSEIVIKQYPLKMEIINAGGFPPGVSIDNLITVPSTPRNRLLADVLSKTGIVERSGQGIDKIFLLTLSEGKPEPDYSSSDDFSVTARLFATIKDKGFAMFIKEIQEERDDDNKLSVFDVITLCAIRDGNKRSVNKSIAHKLEQQGLLEKRGKTSAQFFILSRRYYEMTGNMAEYSALTDWDKKQLFSVLLPFLEKYNTAKKSDINKLVGSHISPKRLRAFLESLIADGMIEMNGFSRGTVYTVGNEYLKNKTIIDRAIKLGLNEMKHNGEI